MGTSLNGLTPAATYQGLIKFGNNSAISATAQYLSDGLGNDLPISVASSSVGINTITGSALFNIQGINNSNSTYSLNIKNLSATDIFQVRNDGYSFIPNLQVTYNCTSLNGAFNSQLEVGSPSIAARLSVKGSGSTSATKTFNIANSSGNNSIQTTDDGLTLLTASLTNTAPLIVNNSYGWQGAYTARIQTWRSAGSDVAYINGSGVIVTTNGVTALTYNATQPASLNDVPFKSVSQGSGNGIIFPAYNNTGIATNQLERMRITANGNMLIKTTIEDTSALLKMDSTTQGMLPPRMTDAQVRAIVTPAVALTCYNTDLDCLVFYSAAGWRKVSHSVM